MNRPMLVIVGLLLLAGLGVALFGGPTMLQRIEQAESCPELMVVYRDIREDVGDRLDTEVDQRRRALGC